MTPAMAGWLRRLSRSELRTRYVLRGSLLTRHWCPERRANDVDHLVAGSFDADRAIAEARSLLSAPDDTFAFDEARASFEIIWAETPFPGLRILAPTRGESPPLQVDLGYGDPLAVEPIEVTLAEVGAPLRGVRPETLYGWKTHGLVEFGRGRWRPKDLYDLWLLERVPMDEGAVRASIAIAFESRSTPLADADRLVFSGEWGRTSGSRRRWNAWKRKASVVAPELGDVLDVVRRRLIASFPRRSTRAGEPVE